MYSFLLGIPANASISASPDGYPSKFAAASRGIPSPVVYTRLKPLGKFLTYSAPYCSTSSSLLSLMSPSVNSLNAINTCVASTSAATSSRTFALSSFQKVSRSRCNSFISLTCRASLPDSVACATAVLYAANSASVIPALAASSSNPSKDISPFAASISSSVA